MTSRNRHLNLSGDIKCSRRGLGRTLNIMNLNGSVLIRTLGYGVFTKLLSGNLPFQALCLAKKKEKKKRKMLARYTHSSNVNKLQTKMTPNICQGPSRMQE